MDDEMTVREWCGEGNGRQTLGNLRDCFFREEPPIIKDHGLADEYVIYIELESA